MSRKKILLILLFLIIFTFAISHVSATEDLNTTDVIGEENNNIINLKSISKSAEDSEILSIDDTEYIEESSNLNPDNDIIGDVNPEYRNIQDEINRAREGSTIYIEGEIFCDYLITINKSIKIESREGATLMYNGSNEYVTPFFYINHTASNVVFKNIKFVGGTFLWSGAMMWHGDNGSLINCEFIDNSVTGTNAIGGALVWFGNNCTIDNCTFKNNHASKNGGAILFNGTGGIIKNCEFSSNEANGEKIGEENYGFGGALVFWGNNYTVINSTFNKNRATNFGGAIASLKDNNTIIHCQFYNNTVINNLTDIYSPEGGGAIYSACENLTIDNCTFIGNDASGANGGAISLSPNDTVKNSFFNGNIANLGNDIAYGNGDNIISNYFLLDYGEHELQAIRIMGISVDDLLKNNNIFEKTKYNSEVSFSAGMIFTYGGIGNIRVTVEGGSIDLNNISVLNHPEAIISFSNDLLTVSNLPVGSFNLQVITTPDEFHNSVTADLSITVNKATAVVKTSAITVAYKKSSLWSITIVDPRNNLPISNMKLTLNVYTGNKFKTVDVITNANGVASYQTKGLSKGTHRIVASTNDASYIFNTLTSSVKVVKQTALVFKVTKKTIKTGATLSITVKNKKTKKPVNGVKIKLLIYTGSKLTKTVVLKSMKKGKYKGVCGYATNKLTVGNHKVKIVPYYVKYGGSATSSMKITKKAKKVPAWETKDSK